MRRLYYFSHRLTDDNPAVQAANLRRASERLDCLRPSYRARGIHLWAPWIDIAVAGVGEFEAWRLINHALMLSDGIVADLSDGGQMYPGTLSEVRVIEGWGRPVEVLR
jgi:hypothetical protein